MNISIPSIRSDDDQEKSSEEELLEEFREKNQSNESRGTSTFILFPVVSSLLNSKTHLASVLALVTVAFGTSTLIGTSSIVIIPTVIALYAVSLSTFEFGETTSVDQSQYEHSLLVLGSAIAIPITIGLAYVGFTFSSSITTGVIGALIITSWVLNRQLYMSMKEDIVDLEARVSKGWLYISRIPLVAALASIPVVNIGMFGWTALTSFLVAISFTYGIVHQFTIDTKNHTTVTIEDKTTSTNSNTGSTTETQSNTMPTSDTSDTSTTENNTDIPNQLQDNYTQAQELTINLSESIESVNTQLEQLGVPRYSLTTVDINDAPPETDTMDQIYNETVELTEYLSDYHEENMELRREVISVQQELQELDEFVYRDVPDLDGHQ